MLQVHDSVWWEDLVGGVARPCLHHHTQQASLSPELHNSNTTPPSKEEIKEAQQRGEHEDKALPENMT